MSRISWDEADVSSLGGLELSDAAARAVDIVVGLSNDKTSVVKAKSRRELPAEGFTFGPTFLAAQFSDLVSNPWAAYQISETVLTAMIRRGVPKWCRAMPFMRSSAAEPSLNVSVSGWRRLYS